MTDRDVPLRARIRHPPLEQAVHVYKPPTPQHQFSTTLPQQRLLPRRAIPSGKEVSKVRAISISALPGLKQAFEDTPIKLRELEEGWRARRRKVLGELTSNEVETRGGPSTRELYANEGEVVNAKGKEKEGKLGIYGIQPRRPSIRFTDEALPPLTPPPTPPPLMKQLPPHLTQRPVVPASNLPRIPTHHVAPSALHNPPKRPYLPPTTAQPTLTKPQPTPPIAPTSILDKSQPQPIHSHPLPPTLKPITLPSSRHMSSPKSTIHILPPPSSTQMLLSLPKRTIMSSQNGNLLTFIDHTPHTAVSRNIDLKEVTSWREEDKRDWEMVRKVIEGYKRSTPRVKIYNPLGHLSITCSTPPDIILSFPYSLDPPLPPHNDMNIDNRVRVTYSRSTKTLRIDVAEGHVQGGKEKRQKYSYRSKRIIPITLPHNDARMLRDGFLNLLRVAGRKEAIDVWSEAEKEGLRRLWVLRDEWTRWH